MKTIKTIFVKTITLSILLTAVIRAESGAVLYASNLDPSKPAAYKIEVSFDSQVTPSSQFEIIFPNAFNVSTAMMAVSDKLDGTLSVTVEKNKLTLNRHSGSNSIAPGDTVDFKIASIINPALLDQEWEFTFLLSDGQIAVEQKVNTKITLIQK